MKAYLFLFLLLVISTTSIAQKPNYEQLAESVFSIYLTHKEIPKGHGSNPSKIKAYRELMTPQSQGNGFLIQRNGVSYLVTCLHVVNGVPVTKSWIKAKDATGKVYTMKLFAADSFYDIALLKFDEASNPQYQPLSITTNSIEAGQEIKAIGHKNGETELQSGETGFTTKNFKDEVGGYGFFKTDARLKAGLSGSPLFSEQNSKVIGMASKAKYYKGEHDGSYILMGNVMNRIINRFFKDKNTIKRLNRLYTGIVFAQKDGLENKVYIKDIVGESPNDGVLNPYIGATIIKIQGEEIHSIFDIYSVLEPLESGVQLKMEFNKNGKIYKKIVSTKTLTKKSLRNVAISHFNNNPNYIIKYSTSGETSYLYDKTTNERKLKIELGGYLSSNNQPIYYGIDGKKDLGVLVRMCSDLGAVKLLGTSKSQRTPINIDNQPKMESYILRLIYY